MVAPGLHISDRPIVLTMIFNERVLALVLDMAMFAFASLMVAVVLTGSKITSTLVPAEGVIELLDSIETVFMIVSVVAVAVAHGCVAG